MVDVSSTAPSAEEIIALYNLRILDGDESRLREMVSSIRILSKLNHTVNIPEQYRAITRAVRTPYLRDSWLRTTAALVAKPPIVHIEPLDEKQQSKDATSVAEKWDMAAMAQLNKEIGQDAIYESAKALVRDGESVLKVVHRPDAWANFPKREGDENAEDYDERADKFVKTTPLPFAWRVVDRLSMLFGNGEYGDDWALEYGEYPKPYLGRRYQMVDYDGRLRDPKDLLGGSPMPEGLGDSATGLSRKFEYINADEWVVVIDGQTAPGFPKKNPYSPRINYFRANAADSESMLYSLLFLVPRLDELLTMKENWAYLGAYPNPVIETMPNYSGAIADMPGGDDGRPAKLQWKPGLAIELPLGKRMTFLVPPPVGADINHMIQILTGLIEIAGIPSILRGMAGTDQAGYAINQLMAAANMSFKVAISGLSRQFEQALEFLHWTIGHRIGQAVYVRAGAGDETRWLGLKPTGSVSTREAPVDKLGPVAMAFRPQLPTDEQARAMIANQLVNSPKQLLSRRRALEKYLQEEDPESVLDEIWVEEAMQQEPLHSMMVAEALRDAGLGQMEQNPAQSLVGPSGQALMSPAMAGIPGQVSVGGPSIGGINRPITPQPPGRGRPAGAFPGQPGTPVA